MRVNDDYSTWNVASELADASSVLNFWKAALSMRKRYEVFVSNAMQPLRPHSAG